MSEETKSAVDSYFSAISSLGGIEWSNNIVADSSNSNVIGLSADSSAEPVDLTAVSIDSSSGANYGTITASSGYGSGLSSISGSSGTITLPYTTPNTGGSIGSWTTTYTTPFTSNKENLDLDLLEDLKEEFEGKLEEAEKNIEELVGQMKEHPEGVSVFGSAFNFFTGQKVILTEMIRKLEAYIKDYTEEETNE